MLSALLSATRRLRPSPSPAPPSIPVLPPAAPAIKPAPAQLAKIAQASVDLAALGPQLAALAADMERMAQDQAQRAANAAAAMEALSLDLQSAVAELRSSSAQMHGALKTVQRIADHTRLLSVNASIEAARAGEAGRSFSVVVDEVKRLADSSGHSTHLIEERMNDINTNVARVAAVTVDPSVTLSNDAPGATRTVSAVNHEVRSIAGTADHQLGSARSVHAMGDRVNALTESLLLTVGRFRFDAHGRAQSAVEKLLPNLTTALDSRVRSERVIASWLLAHPYFELGYLTDAAGRQIIDNLRLADGRIVHDRSSFNRDWSDRPWYREALQHRAIASTDIYRSSATGDFCFTIAAALHDDTGSLSRIFAADVNFQRLVSA